MVNVAKNVVLRMLSHRATPALKSRSLKTTEAFVGVLGTGAMSLAHVRAALDHLRRSGTTGTVEILFHPGRARHDEASLWSDRPELRAFYLSADRDREAELLCSPAPWSTATHLRRRSPTIERHCRRRRGSEMNVLGVFGATDVVHPAACLLRDGRLVAFAEEERFARVKQACGLFPAQAMAWCLRDAGLSLGDVDAMAFGWDANANWFRLPLSMARSFVGSRLSRRARKSRLRRHPDALGWARRRSQGCTRCCT